MSKINVCIGSLNPTKIEATQKAFNKFYERFTLYKIKVDSSVSNQPIGIENIIEGAKNRALGALSFLHDKSNSINVNLGVGIESGLIKIPQSNTGYMDLQFCTIVDDNNKMTLGSGNAFEYPQSVIKEVLADNKTEIGVIIGKLANNKNLKNETGAISFLSNQKITRVDILTYAVICALIPRINKEIYE